jgi:hypothetical protein
VAQPRVGHELLGRQPLEGLLADGQPLDRQPVAGFFVDGQPLDGQPLAGLRVAVVT